MNKKILFRPVQSLWSSDKERLSWWELLFTFKRAEHSLSKRTKGISRLAPWLLAVSTLTLVAGLYLPIVKVTKLFIFTDYISIGNAIYVLMKSREYALGVVILLFSIVFPTLKLLIADYVWRARCAEHRNNERALWLINALGKWSMLDVFIVGMIVFSVKSTGLANATSQPGLYFFGVSVLSSMLGILLLKRALRKASAPV